MNATTLSGNNPAHKVLYTNREGEDEHKIMQILSITDDKIYLLTYSAEKRKYSDYLLTIEKMIDSFELVTYNGDALMPNGHIYLRINWNKSKSVLL